MSKGQKERKLKKTQECPSKTNNFREATNERLVLKVQQVWDSEVPFNEEGFNF